MSAGALKLIACAAMLFDHAAAAFGPDVVWLRVPGRVSFPIMAFLIAEGAHHTKNAHRYALRLAAVALASQPVYGLLFYGSWRAYKLSALFTLLLGLLAVLSLRRADAAGLAGVLGLVLAARLLGTDYGGVGVLLILLFSLWRGQRLSPALPLALFCLLLTVSAVSLFWGRGGLAMVRQRLPFFSMTVGPLLALPFLCCYNGRRGAVPGWLFYAFYPLHLLGLLLFKTLEFP